MVELELANTEEESDKPAATELGIKRTLGTDGRLAGKLPTFDPEAADKAGATDEKLASSLDEKLPLTDCGVIDGDDELVILNFADDALVQLEGGGIISSSAASAAKDRGELIKLLLFTEEETDDPTVNLEKLELDPMCEVKLDTADADEALRAIDPGTDIIFADEISAEPLGGLKLSDSQHVVFDADIIPADERLAESIDELKLEAID